MRAGPAAISIRSYNHRDLAPILQIERESFGRDAWTRDLFEKLAAENPAWFLVAEHCSGIAGYCIAAMARGGAEIASIAVSVRHRRTGIAQALLRATFARLRRAGLFEVRLMVRRENTAAIRLYRALGFVRTATVRGYYGDGKLAWRMRLALTPRSCRPSCPSRDT